MTFVKSLARSTCRASIGTLPLLLAAHALANDYYVNPQTGHDYWPGTQAQPLKTLGVAINKVAGLGTHTGVVRAMPGIYADSPAYNSEAFPLLIPAGVALQGVGAKECVIRRLQVTGSAGTHPGKVFLPHNPANVSSLPSDYVYPILDFSNAVHSDYTNTFVEGFTFQGGQVQIYTTPEDHQAIRISNCVFDLRNGGDEVLPGPEFGILLTSVWQALGGYYPELEYHILNNTFIAGYQISSTAMNVSIPSCVALCNSNDPAGYTSSPDPNLMIRGVSDLNVQNNLFRILPNQLAMAMLGIDSTDTTALVGVAPPGHSLPCPSNAFDVFDTGGFSADPGRKWFSGLDTHKSFPTAILAIDRSATPRVDPGFVGEMIGQTQLGLTYPHVRDWRLLQTSALKDIGTTPLITATSATIGATDGITFSESLSAPDQAFDWDGEGFGNPRIVDGVIDVGYDEIDKLTIAGSYGSDSKSHGYPYDPKVTPGNIQRTYIRRPGSTSGLYVSMSPYVSGKAYDIPPGTTTMGTPPFGTGPWYLAPPSGVLTPMTWTLVGWTNPVDGFVHSVNQALATFNDYPPYAGAPVYLNTQAMVGSASANLQSEVR